MIEHAKEMMGMNIELRKLLDSDKETYFELENETWVNKRMLQDEEANDRSWKAMFADTEAHYAVLMGDQVCGFASILKLGEEVRNLGWNFLKDSVIRGLDMPLWFGYWKSVRMNIM